MKVNLEKKMKEYGRKVLSNKESKGAERKKRRKVQHLRRAIRQQREAKMAELDALIEEELEKEKIMEEYLAAEDAEVVGGEQDGSANT